MNVTARQIQRGLGVLWLIDGLLQLQPFMFGSGFANEILAPAADGQPGWVSGPVTFFADVIGAHPGAYNSAFAVIQIAIGVGLLVGRGIRIALAASIAWSLGVWWFGEGLGGLASGHASLVNGAPGAVALYGMLAAAAWPTSRCRTRPAGWLPRAWAVIWLGGAIVQLLPGQSRASELAAIFAGNADGAPTWLAALDRGTAGFVAHSPVPATVVLAAVMAVVGLLALQPGTARNIAAIAGGTLALAFWVVGQNLGEIYTARSTDPNTGPLLVLIAVGIVDRAAQHDRASGRPHLTDRPRESLPVPG